MISRLLLLLSIRSVPWISYPCLRQASVSEGLLNIFYGILSLTRVKIKKFKEVDDKALNQETPDSQSSIFFFFALWFKLLLQSLIPEPSWCKNHPPHLPLLCLSFILLKIRWLCRVEPPWLGTPVLLSLSWASGLGSLSRASSYRAACPLNAGQWWDPF